MILYDYIWVALGSIKYAGCFWEFLHLLGTILFILMKKNHFGSDGLVGFCVFCDITLIYCVIFLSMQTGTNGFVLLVSVFLCIILVFFFHLGSCCEIIYKKTDCRNVGSQLV